MPAVALFQSFMGKEGEGRYKPSAEEEAILAKYIKLYQTCDKRTSERSKLNADCLEELAALGPAQREHWTMTNVRQWYTNNKKKYLKDSSPAKEAVQVPVVRPPNAQQSSEKRLEDWMLQIVKGQAPKEKSQVLPPSPVVQRIAQTKVASLPAPNLPDVPVQIQNSENSKNVTFDPQGRVQTANREISFNLEDGPPKALGNDLDVTLRDQAPRPMSRTLSRTMSNGYTILDKMVPNAETRREEPTVTIPPVLTTKERQNSNAKMNLMAALQKYHETGKEISKLEKTFAQEYQKELENNFVQTVQYLIEITEKLWVPCPNKCADKVSCTLSAKFRRQHSCTTQIYSGMSEYTESANPKLVGKFTQVSPIQELPNNLPEPIHNMYSGKFETRSVTDITGAKLCELTTNHIFIATMDGESWLLKNNTISVALETEPEKMFYDEERDTIWVIMGSSIHGFRGSTLEHFDTLSVEGTVSCMTFWNDRIVAAVARDLLAWHTEPLEADRTSPRQPMSLGYNIELEKITSVAAVGEYLVVADCDYPVAHVYYKKQVGNDVWTRLISHTMGITVLLGFHGKQVFTGSHDHLSYLWNLDSGECVTLFTRHGKSVVDLDCQTFCGTLELFSVGEDCVHVWDIQRKRWMMDFVQEEDTGLSAKKVKFTPETGIVQILASNENHSEIQTFVFNKV